MYQSKHGTRQEAFEQQRGQLRFTPRGRGVKQALHWAFRRRAPFNVLVGAFTGQSARLLANHAVAD